MSSEDTYGFPFSSSSMPSSFANINLLKEVVSLTFSDIVDERSTNARLFSGLISFEENHP